jgi:hypothetical protein
VRPGDDVNVREAWRRYWSAPGGRRAAAIVRIALAASVLWTLARLGAAVVGDADAAPRAIYRPISWWLIFGPHAAAPSTFVVDALRIVAWTSTLAMLVGVASRLATAVSLVSALGLAAFACSFSATWSHAYNVVFLAQIAFLGARGGDAFSVDAWWRARRGRPLPAGAAYTWSLRLVQLAVALMFASAFVCKIGGGGGTLRWAFSDNLRHQLLARFDLIGVPRTAAADWLLGAPWRWQAAAVGNLISQAMPIGAVFAVRRPWLRAAFGSFFVVETLALGMVMDLWNLHWLPLAAVFVDWDAVLGAAGAADPAGATGAPSRAARRFVLAFVVYDVFVSFAPRLDQALRTYPFSSFPMFAKVLAKRPYDRHQSFELVGARIEVEAAPGERIDPALQTWIDRSYEYRTMWRLHADPAALERRLRSLLAEVQARAGRDVHVRRLRLRLGLFQAPPVPAPAGLTYLPFLVVAEVDAGAEGAPGGFRMFPIARP